MSGGGHTASAPPSPDGTTYDPFSRGAAPVGVRTLTLCDGARGRRELQVELWYPASEDYRGQDLSPSTQDQFTVAPRLPVESQRAVRDATPSGVRAPLVAFFHGAIGHRRGNSWLCSHLASHGYVVVSPDFSGNTLADQMHDLATGDASQARVRPTEQVMIDRPLDASFVLDCMLAGAASDVAEIDVKQGVATCGVSMGGWTCLALNSIDARPSVTVPIVPAWGKGPVGTELLSSQTRLDNWKHPVETLVIAAECDAMVMLDSLRELHRQLEEPKRLVVLQNAGHAHFVDDPERRHEAIRTMLLSNTLPGGDTFDFAALAEACRPFAELCPAWHGEDTVGALCLAQFDARLKGALPARNFLERNLAATFRDRGITIEVV